VNAFDDSYIVGETLQAELLDMTDCNYSTSCPILLCDMLKNRTLSKMGLSFVVIVPSFNMNVKVPFISNITMILFIINNEGRFITPIACSNVGDCFNKGYTLFNVNKTNLGIGFLGQCV
jgi:hypothetical protein